jgi:competence protein ComEA
MSHPVVLVILLALVALSSSASATTVTLAETVKAAAPRGGARININTAGVDELMKLSGVDRSLAEKIVKYRDAHGLFKKATDLRNVEGVGGALWQKNRARIVVK